MLVSVDALLLPLALWLSFWLRLAHPFHPNFLIAGPWLLLAVLLVGLPLYSFTGQYIGFTCYVGSQALYRLAGRNGLLVLLSVRPSGVSNRCLRVGLAAACRRCHCSIGTRTAASVPRRDTTWGPSR